MKKKTGIALFCAGALTAGSIFGLTGFASQDNTEQGGRVGTYSLVSTSSVDEAEVDDGEGTATVEDVAAAVMPAVVSITNGLSQRYRISSAGCTAEEAAPMSMKVRARAPVSLSGRTIQNF